VDAGDGTAVTSQETPARPAATVVLVRDGEDGLETLLLHRNSALAFGGMWVFPGGQIDDADRHGAGDDLDAARRAAVREAREEAGLVIDPAALRWISTWVPPPIAPVRFHTWFFLADAPEGLVAIDQGEIHDHAWMRPDHAMELRDRGEIELAPPTWVTLHGLAGHASALEAITSVDSAPPRHFATRLLRHGDTRMTVWAGDAGYESGDPFAPGPRRRLWLEATWRFEDDRPDVDAVPPAGAVDT
jgi:8-oxo-dGTP pyrophosphatase MutT (NUDIX family)